MKKFDTIGIDVEVNADEAIEKTNELVSLMDEITPQVVIRGARDCTFNIYPSSTRIYYGKDTDDDDAEDAEDE